MLNKASSKLTDGTRIEDLIDIEKREVSARVLSDPEIYQLELERIFGKAWLLLGHDTEIPKAGDYVVRDMGEDQVIVSRDRAGQVHVLLNMCTHQGMRVAMDRGCTQVHRCVYHGWAFRPDGSFIGAPIEREQMHGSLCPKEGLGLRKARVQLYGGLIFATWNIRPSLEEFSGIPGVLTCCSVALIRAWRCSGRRNDSSCPPTGRRPQSSPPRMAFTP